MLNRVSQTGIKLEASEGVEETLIAADFAGNRKEQNNSSEIAEYERALQRSSLSEKPTLKGQRTARLSWLEELVGGSAGGAPVWHRSIRAMGFKTQTLKVVSAGAQSGGTFRMGQTVGNNAVLGAATATGVFVKFIAGSPNKIVYLPVTGVFANAETMYNYAAPQVSSVLSSGPTDAGFALSPESETDSVLPQSATVERRFGGQRYTLIGSRGTGGFSLRQSEPALLRCEYQGCPVYDPANEGRPKQGGFIAGVPDLPTPPKLSKGVPLTFRDGSTVHTPILLELDVDFGNTLAPRATITNADLAGSGYLPTRITDRKMRLRVDPEKVVPGTFDFDAILNTGRTFEIASEIGLANDGNGLIGVWVPAAQAIGGLEYGDRDGQVTQPFNVMATGNADDEFFLFHVFVP